MRPFVTIALLSLGVAAWAEVQSLSRNEAAEKEIAQMDRDFHQARFRNDVAAVNRFLAADYYQIYSGGESSETGNKSAGPFNTTPTGVRWEKVDVSNQRVRVYGDAAVSTYRRHIEVRNRDGFNLISTHVWIRRDGRWQLVQSQATTVE